MNEGVKTCGKPSRGRYSMGCRCFMCRQANSEYEYRRTHGAAGSMVGECEVEEARAKVEGVALAWNRPARDRVLDGR